VGATKDSVVLWPGNKIPYEPFDDLPTRARIFEAMTQIESNTQFWFSRRGDEPNFVRFTCVEGRGTHNSSSSIGMATGAITVNIKNSDGAMWATHELCHVLGLVHEQCRFDSQHYIDTYFRTSVEITMPCVTIPVNPGGNVDPRSTDMRVRCDTSAITAYDPVSIMQYPSSMGRIDGTTGPTMVWRADHSFHLGADDAFVLDYYDIASLNALATQSPYRWSDPTPIPGVSTQHGVGVAWSSAERRLWAIWNGYHDDGIYYASHDGTGWSQQHPLSGVATDAGLAMTEYVPGVLIAAWKEQGVESIRFASWDGRNWSPGPPYPLVPGARTRSEPALASFDGHLFVAWNHPNGRIYYATLKAGTSDWSTPAPIDNTLTDDPPALAATADTLYLAWNNFDTGIRLAAYQNGIWNPDRHPSGVSTKVRPALAPYRSLYDYQRACLYLTWTNPGGQHLSWAAYDLAAHSWSGSARTTYLTIASPALATAPDGLYMLWPAQKFDDAADVGIYSMRLDAPTGPVPMHDPSPDWGCTLE
jgi:hypothetical protein